MSEKIDDAEGGSERFMLDDERRLDEHVAALRADPEVRAWVQGIHEAAERIRTGVSTPEAEGWGKPFTSPADLEAFIEAERRRFFDKD